ncbi:MAG: CheR family methyltransferase [Bacteroidia bacterium]
MKEKKSNIPKVKSPFTIVAIGSSAGGLEAGTELFKNLPATTGMAFIFVQHLSRDYKSLLVPILSKTTKMKVQEIDNMEAMLPNNVYVIPNDKDIKVTDGHIKLIPRAKPGAAISIDVLFTSLALTHKENVIGVVLSGNAHDGTKGLKAIKAAGGITFAQDHSAEVTSMPDSAIAANVVDFILSPKQIAQRIVKLSKIDYKNDFLNKKKVATKEEEPKINTKDSDVKVILDILKKEINADFSAYKVATVERRIEHRMRQNSVNTFGDYAKLLVKNKNEALLLHKALLINVTSFFRDTETFKFLKSSFLPTLLKDNTQKEVLRLWIPACSSGEEVYSIAILLTELQQGKIKKIPFQIFATDLSEEAIHTARIGVYEKEQLKAVDKKRIDLFFIKSGDTYQITPELRKTCVFATHNILSDPPFSKIDFISCRNLLIYFDNVAQKKTLRAFHFALNEGGYLMLGKSETTGTSSTLFNQLNNKFRIYSRKKQTGIRIMPELSHRLREPAFTEQRPKNLSKKNATVNSTMLANAVDAELLLRYMPTCVIINKNLEIIKFRGQTAIYLSHPSGNASLNILKMIRPEFTFELRNAIQECIKANKPIVKEGIEIHNIHQPSGIVSIDVSPLKIEWGEPLFMVVFTLREQVDKYIESSKDKKNYLAQKNTKIKKQIIEFNRAATAMATVIESQDRAYEELQLANEEIISASEEFQTLNEELETSKEEIEATNEELQTTNQELQIRNEQLAESYKFSETLSETMHEPMLILDKNSRIKSANNSFCKKFKVVKKNIEGKLLFEFSNHQWNIPSLRELLEKIILKNSHFYDFEITHDFPRIGKKTMLLNAQKIVQKTNNEHLVLLTFVDITQIDQQRKLEKKELEHLIGEGTKDLAKSHKTLLEKNISLEKINKELETFTFISSHDLQEPLRKIKMFTTCLLDEENKNLSISGKEYLKKTQTVATRMQLLLTDLLAYAGAKKLNHKFEYADLNKIVKDLLPVFHEALKEKKGEIKVEKLCHADIIGFQFRQVLFNLINNSLKFSDPKRPLRITIKSKTALGKTFNNSQLSPEIKYCHIAIADNGIGFDPKYKDQIFEVFQRLHGQKEYPGSGIGLAICKRIIESHNGVITATGEVNKGARFDIYIPVYSS